MTTTNPHPNPDPGTPPACPDTPPAASVGSDSPLPAGLEAPAVLRAVWWGQVRSWIEQVWGVVVVWWTRLVPDAVASLCAKPFRAVAMMCGIYLGVCGALSSLMLADIQQASVTYRFDLQRSHHVVTAVMGPTTLDPLMNAQLRELDGVIAAGQMAPWNPLQPFTTGPADTRYRTATLLAADAGGLAAADAHTVAGTPVELIDGLAGRDVVWIGHHLASDLGYAPGPPRILTLSGREMSVAGVVQAPEGFGYLNSGIITHPDDAAAIGPPEEGVRWLARVRPGAADIIAEHAEQSWTAVGAAAHNQTAQDGKILSTGVGQDLRLLGIGLGIVVGVVSMFAIANTLMMAVHQRAAELGLRAAIGWSRRRLATLVLTEAALCGTLAATIAAATSYLALACWTTTTGNHFVADPTTTATVTALGIAASIIGGLAPALTAAQQSPLTAMRS